MGSFFTMFIEFFKTGLFSIGGGIATIPFLMEMSDKYGWFTKGELSDMIAVAESTPGPIGVNTATFAGIKSFGLLGGVVATLGLILPSYITIVLIYKVLEKFRDSKTVESVFYGLRPAVAALILSALLSLLKVTVIKDAALDIKAFCVFAVFTFAALYLKKLNPITLIILGAAAGILLKL